MVGFRVVIPAKVSIFMLRALSNCIATDLALRRFHIPLVSQCWCCLRAVESIDHILVCGDVISSVWRFFECYFGIIDDGM